MKEAQYYTSKEDRVICRLCPRECVISEGKAGVCHGRINQGGKLYAETYGECSSIAMDPIEKKPLYHFYPGSQILSIGTIGCNLKCQFCQNWHISQGSVPAQQTQTRMTGDTDKNVRATGENLPAQQTQTRMSGLRHVPTQQISPEDIVRYAKEYNSVGVAYTYNEPLIWYEYVLDTARLVREASLKNVLVTNGFINEEPLQELLPYIDALNIDVKSMKNSFYWEICGGAGLHPVLNTVKLAKNKGCWVELTNLVIPGLNDSPAQIDSLISWILKEIGDNVPLHFSRYFPNYKMSLPPTPISTLERIYRQAASQLKYVYLGNTAEADGDSTLCPNCKQVVIKRRGYLVSQPDLKNGQCRWCGAEIDGRWEVIAQ